MTSYVPEYLKAKNRKLIFDLFVKQNELSRAEIVRQTHMSFPTASKAVDFLLSRHIIEELGSSADTTERIGRKRQMLRFNPRAYCALAINFEGKMMEVGLVDLAGKLQYYEETEFDCFAQMGHYEQLTARLCDIVAQADCPVLGVGIGVPANVNAVTQEIGMYTGGVDQVVSTQELFGTLLQTLGLPSFVENDVNLACQGEVFAREPARSQENLCYLTLGSGFGAGIMANGHLWTGDNFRAGEIGNMQLTPFDLDAPIQPQVNPLENNLNIRAIQKQFGIDLLESPVLDEEQRQQIIRFLLPHLATAIYNFSFLFDIDQIVLSGLIPYALGEDLIRQTEQTANRLLAHRNRQVSVGVPHSRYSTLIGAASVVFDGTILNELQG